MIAYGVTGLIESCTMQIRPQIPPYSGSSSPLPFTSTIMIRQRLHASSLQCYVVCCAGTNHTHNYPLCTKSHLLHTPISHLYTSGNACTSHNPEAEAGPSCTHRGGSGVSDLSRCNNNQIHIHFPSPLLLLPSPLLLLLLPSPLLLLPSPLPAMETELKPMSISSLSSCSTILNSSLR